MSANWRQWYQRLKSGDIQLLELDWAICERGGTEAQAQAHRRRGERPCRNCLRAQAEAQRCRRRRIREATQ